MGRRLRPVLPVNTVVPSAKAAIGVINRIVEADSRQSMGYGGARSSPAPTTVKSRSSLVICVPREEHASTVAAVSSLMRELNLFLALPPRALRRQDTLLATQATLPEVADVHVSAVVPVFAH